LERRGEEKEEEELRELRKLQELVGEVKVLEERLRERVRRMEEGGNVIGEREVE
jgi:hypothetical protein